MRKPQLVKLKTKIAILKPQLVENERRLSQQIAIGFSDILVTNCPSLSDYSQQCLYIRQTFSGQKL